MRNPCQAQPQTVRPPRFRLPKGATDTHFHVFGPVSKFSYLPNRAYTPQDALPAAAGRLFAVAGIERAVLVQPGVYGTDNSRHLTAAKEIGIPARVVVAVETETPDDVLTDLHVQGACGVRRILVGQEGAAVEKDLARLADRLAEIGWHLQLLVKPEQLIQLEGFFTRLPCPLVFDHLGMINPNGGPSQPALRALLNILKGGKNYAKLSGYYRLSQAGPPYADVTALVAPLVEAVPEQLLWGSDWPHPAYAGPTPDLAELIDPLADWLSDEALRNRVLVENPATFYGFGKTPNELQRGDA